MGASSIIRPLPILLLIVQAFALAATAQTSDSTNEAWPEFDFYIKINEKSRIFAMYTATRQEDLGTYADGQTGVHIDFYAGPVFHRPFIKPTDASRSKLLMLRAGYLVSRPINNSGTATEHMVIGEGTGRTGLTTGLLLSDRNRFDFRWVDGDPRQRYRNRLKLEKTFDVGRFQLTPYAHAEVFYDLKEGNWTRLRYSAGAEWNITKRIVLEGYYLRQNTWGSVPQFVNAIGSAVQFYIR
jgi:hypothetical protein